MTNMKNDCKDQTNKMTKVTKAPKMIKMSKRQKWPKLQTTRNHLTSKNPHNDQNHLNDPR